MWCLWGATKESASGIDEQADGSKVLCSWRVVGTASLLSRKSESLKSQTVCGLGNAGSREQNNLKHYSLSLSVLCAGLVKRCVMHLRNRGKELGGGLSPVIGQSSQKRVACRCDAGKEGHGSFKEFSFPLDK